MKTDIEQVREAMLTPEQIESLADFVLKYGDLDNTGLMLKTMILRQKAEAARKALPLLDGKVLVNRERLQKYISIVEPLVFGKYDTTEQVIAYLQGGE